MTLSSLEMGRLVFEEELRMIRSKTIRLIVEEALRLTPKYFFQVPASSSGKYHPKYSSGVGGLVRHTKAVFKISEILLSHPMMGEFSDYTKDIIRVAIILHDTCKLGVEDEGKGTRADHPLLVRHALEPSWSILGIGRGEALEIWSEICDLIETHMGPWTRDYQGKEILKRPKTPAQKHVHLCDYLASRRDFEVDIWTKYFPKTGIRNG